ncbi:MAG: sulfite exporter TauE/SafE family protein [Methanobrevibacter wolinii]|nr:sulfite exporter TauE/SafE family protein [Methanobrevibacter wolinii]
MFKIIFSIFYYIFLGILGIIVGLASGLLGIGGGFLMVPLQYFALSYAGVNPDIGFKVALGTSLACIIPTALSGAYIHNKKSDINILKPGIVFGIFGAIGGFIGGKVAVLLPSRVLELAIGIILILIAINVFIERDNSKKEPKLKLNFTYGAIFGIFIGFCAGLFGIGGGVILMPILMSLFGFSLIEAIATSTIFIPFTSIGGTISYIISGLNMKVLPYSIGYVNLINFFIIILFSIPMARFGAKIAYKIDEKKLKIIYAAVLIIISFKLLGIIPI